MSSQAPTSTNPVDMESPTAIAAAAYTAAVANRERQEKSKRSTAASETQQDNDDETLTMPTQLFKTDANNNVEECTDENVIQNIWKGDNAESNLNKTLALLMAEIDSMVQSGLGAFHDLDAATRQLVQSKEMVETRSREAQRFHVVEDQSRASLSKLLRAVEASKSTARDSSRSAQIESRLRSDINKLRDERDASLTELSTLRRKLSLNEEELRLTKSKLNRVIQEKHSMERDSRAAISLARSLDNNNSNDYNYYKRKVGELSDQLQVAQRRVGELTERLGERSPKKKKVGH